MNLDSGPRSCLGQRGVAKAVTLPEGALEGCGNDVFSTMSYSLKNQGFFKMCQNYVKIGFLDLSKFRFSIRDAASNGKGGP